MANRRLWFRLDTNNDRTQAARAAAFLRSQDRVFVAKTVVLELEWVLRSAYRINRDEIVPALRPLLSTNNIEIEDAISVADRKQFPARAGYRSW